MSASNSKSISIESKEHQTESVGPSEYSSEFVQLPMVCWTCPYVCLCVLFVNGLLNVQKMHGRRRMPSHFLSIRMPRRQTNTQKMFYHNFFAHTNASVGIGGILDRTANTHHIVWFQDNKKTLSGSLSVSPSPSLTRSPSFGRPICVCRSDRCIVFSASSHFFFLFSFLSSRSHITFWWLFRARLVCTMCVLCACVCECARCTL